MAGSPASSAASTRSPRAARPRWSGGPRAPTPAPTTLRLAHRVMRQLLRRDGKIDFLPLAEHGQGNGSADTLFGHEPVKVVDVVNRDAIGGDDDVAAQDAGFACGTGGASRLHQHRGALVEPVEPG